MSIIPIIEHRYTITSTPYSPHNNLLLHHPDGLDKHLFIGRNQYINNNNFYEWVEMGELCITLIDTTRRLSGTEWYYETLIVIFGSDLTNFQGTPFENVNTENQHEYFGQFFSVPGEPSEYSKVNLEKKYQEIEWYLLESLKYLQIPVTNLARKPFYSI